MNRDLELKVIEEFDKIKPNDGWRIYIGEQLQTASVGMRVTFSIDATCVLTTEYLENTTNEVDACMEAIRSMLEHIKYDLQVQVSVLDEI